jgi:hypothetical protein
MRKYVKPYAILMIFSLLWFAVALNTAYGQEDESHTQKMEQQVLNSLNEGNTYQFDHNSNSVELPEKFRRADAQDEEYKKLSSEQNQNYIQLQMNGSNNKVDATQRQGNGNYMSLEVDGNANKGDYLQQGSNNIIYDRIDGNNISRVIEQKGNGLGIYNQGMQTIPMKIRQTGQGTKLLIEGR